MELLWILLGAAAMLGLVTVLIAYICYRMAFFSAPRKPLGDEIQLPEGKIYEAYRESMERWAREARALDREDVSITSFDGLTLRGYYYEYAPGAPIELMFHGYRGSGERDMPGGVQRCFRVGRSALVVDQRASGRSDGSVITFGILEHRDCLAWVDFAVSRFGPDVKLILTGISMGAATVLTAAGKPMPSNVIGVLADCGFNSPKDIIKKVIRQMGLPAELAYPFVKLGARLFGHFDLEQTSAQDAMGSCTLPVIFYHGSTDDYVPCEMSKLCYDACTSKKQLVVIPNAGHGLCYAVDPATYIQTLREFFGEEASCPAK